MSKACRGYNCNCQKMVLAASKAEGIWDYCADCKHCTSTHYGFPLKGKDGNILTSRQLRDKLGQIDPNDNGNSNTDGIVYNVPKVKAKSEPIDMGEMTTGEMRQILRANGHTVGERGRLSPDQKKLALSLKGK